jgi:hypothetical protein
MTNRCCNPNNSGYEIYGGRGIKVCLSWRRSFERFRDWALTHGYTDDLIIRRINVDGNYTPSNCVWSPKDQINRNRRSSRWVTAWEETKTVRDWIDDPRCGLTGTVHSRYGGLQTRLNMGWPPETAISAPFNSGRQPRKPVYGPKNRWVTAWGETKTLAEWERDSRSQIGAVGLARRLDRLGWAPEVAITTPSRRRDSPYRHPVEG